MLPQAFAAPLLGLLGRAVLSGHPAAAAAALPLLQDTCTRFQQPVGVLMIMLLMQIKASITAGGCHACLHETWQLQQAC